MIFALCLSIGLPVSLFLGFVVGYIFRGWKDNWEKHKLG